MAMLIHKRTMGVLERIWTGDYQKNSKGDLMPINRAAKLSDVDAPDDWWEIPDGTPLSKTIHIYYPWIIPEVDSEGMLIGVKLDLDRSDLGTIESTKKRIRRKGLMPFLKKEE